MYWTGNNELQPGTGESKIRACQLPGHSYFIFFSYLASLTQKQLKIITLADRQIFSFCNEVAESHIKEEAVTQIRGSE